MYNTHHVEARHYTNRFKQLFSGAGWSSLVARRAHNPKVVGSNPAPSTTENKQTFKALQRQAVPYKRGMEQSGSSSGS